MENRSKNINNTSQNKILTNSSTKNFNADKIGYGGNEEIRNNKNRKPSNPNIKKFYQSKNSIEDLKYLKCRKWQYTNDDNHLLIEHEIELILQKSDENKLNKLIKDIKDSNLDEIFNQNFGPMGNEYSIGPLNSLDYLIENTYELNPTTKKVMHSDQIRLKPYLNKYRKIKKDGNCFFLGFIFSFLEYIILTNNKMLLKELLIIFNEKISENNPKLQNKEYLKESMKKVDTENVIGILIIIIKYMEEENLEDFDEELTPYKILLKVFLNCAEFVYGIIFFTRYLLYEYISENEQKIYSKEIKLEIGNLLPEKYILENEGKYKYLFEDFYKELMNLGECNERINVFIAPYVFKCNLKILKYNSNPEDNTIKESIYKCGKYTDIEINLLLRDNHYDIYYKIYFYEKYYQQLDILIDNNENLSVLKFSNNSHIRNVKSYSKHHSMKNSSNLTLFKPNNKSENINWSLNPFSALNENKKKGINHSIIQKETKFINQIINNSNNIYQLPKCTKCKKTYEHKENVFSYCNNCLKMELKDLILQGYFDYLQKGYIKNCEEKLNNFISNIKCSISTHYNIFLSTAIHNSGFKFRDLFMEIKQNMCLFCGTNIENNKSYLELPCKCQICTKNCFDKYIKNIDQMNQIVIIDGKEDLMCIIPMTECPCGYKYNLKSFLNLIEKLKEKSYKKIYEEQIKNNWKWLCMICRQNFNKKNQYFRLFLNDDHIDKNLLKNIELKHLICKDCAQDKRINEIRSIFCQFCESEHQIDNIKNVDSDNKTESACIII